MIYFCATPIGNLEDITLRVLRILREVDVIAAEDTRQALKLLSHYGISKKVFSYHHHNKKHVGQRIVDLAKEGKTIAVLSDAGMPGISDPGSELVQLARENDVSYTVLPGPSAVLSALLLSGMDGKRFSFEGFLPRDKKDRKVRLQELKYELRTSIIFEAPHRLIRTLGDLREVIGNRKIAVARELTKIFEEVFVCDIEEAINRFTEREPKGEIVLVLQGANIEGREVFVDVSIKDHIEEYINAGLDKKAAIKQVALERKMAKSQVYRYTIDDNQNK